MLRMTHPTKPEIIEKLGVLHPPSVLSHQKPIASAGVHAAYVQITQAGAPNKTRLSKLLRLIDKQAVKPRGGGENTLFASAAQQGENR